MYGQSGDDLLVENDHYALVYNNSLGGTYELLRRVSEEICKFDDVAELKDDIWYDHFLPLLTESSKLQMSSCHRVPPCL